MINPEENDLLPEVLGDEQNEEKAIIEIEQGRLYKQINEKFNTAFVTLLKRLSYYLAKVGLPFDEACRMVRVDPKEMKEHIANHPIIQELIELKELEYKSELIASVSNKARAGNDKLAQWLLEKRFPNEFNTKKGSSNDDDGNDMLEAAIAVVQRGGDANPLVSEKSGVAFIKTKNSEKTLRDLASILN